MARQTDLTTLWRNIVQAGGIQAYVQAQLVERGFAVQRRETDGMSQRELAQYKKSLKAEAEERRKLKRESWEAYRSSHIVFLGENVFWSDDSSRQDKWDLPNAEERAAENELPPLDNPQQLADALELSISHLRWMAFHREAATRIHYVRFTIPKHDGSERAIWAPLPKLKAAQRWILRNIVERLPVHGAAHGFLPGRSTLSNANVHTNSKAILQMDVKDFFPTVTLPRVKGIFRNAGYREQIATLLALLCTESPREIVEEGGQKYFVALGPRCLPQGAPTSPALTNTLCLRMDRRIHGLATKNGWRYTRYADDMTFSWPESNDGDPNPDGLAQFVKIIAEDEGFKIHDKKTRVARKGRRQRITGFVVNGEMTPRVPRSLKRQLRAMIHNLKNGKSLQEGETLEMLAGYAAYVMMSDREMGAKMMADLQQLAPTTTPE